MQKPKRPTKPASDYVASMLSEMLAADHGLTSQELEQITDNAKQACSQFDSYLDLANTLDEVYLKFDADYEALNSASINLEHAITNAVNIASIPTKHQQLVYGLWMALLFSLLNSVHPVSIFSVVTTNLVSRLTSSYRTLVSPRLFDQYRSKD